MPLFAELSEAISPDQPCGPDPELDPEILNFIAVAEGQLPASYRDFDKKAFNAKPVLDQLHKLLGRSRDIRFLMLCAKYYILSDNIHGYAESIAAAEALLRNQWEACHPTEAAGGAALRAAYVKTLDDLPTSVLPVQSATLLTDKRAGAVSWRAVLLADKKLQPKADEKIVDRETIKDALARHEPAEDVLHLRATIAGIGETLRNIRQLFIDKAGHEIAPQFEELPDLLGNILAFLDEAVGKEEPPAAAEDLGGENADLENAAPDAAPAQGAPSAAIASVKEASNALAAILKYYADAEPSSPARLLVKQAHQLVGKSFVEAMKVLAPKMAEQSKIHIGGDAPFTLDFARLTALATEEAHGPGADGSARDYSAKTRADASDLMRAVEQFYRKTEPSSPIPLLVERARNFVAKDFASLMKEMVKRDEKT